MVIIADPTSSVTFRYGVIKKELYIKINKSEAISLDAYSKLEQAYAQLDEYYSERGDIKNKTLDYANLLYVKSYYLMDNNSLSASVDTFLQFIITLLKRYKIDAFNIKASFSLIRPYVIRLDAKSKEKTYGDFKRLPVVYALICKLHELKITGYEETKEVMSFLRLVMLGIKSDIVSFDSSYPSYIPFHEDLLIKSKQVFSSENKSQIVSLIGSIYYRLAKNILFHKVRIDDHENLDNIAELMKLSAEEAFENYISFLNAIRHNPNSAVLGLQIDKEYAKYYYYYYCKLNPRKAIDALKKIEGLLIINKLEEDIERENQINYFTRELSHFMTFIKLIILKMDITEKLSMMKEDWEKDMYSKLLQKLDESVHLFRRNKDIKVDEFELKIISSTFSGIITEFFIYRILINLSSKKNNLQTIRRQELTELVKVLQSITPANIKLREELVLGDNRTDADILISEPEKNSCISIKNRPIGGCKRDLKNELKIFEGKNITHVYLLLNLLKTEKVDYLWLKEYVRENHKTLQVDIFDIRDFIDQLLELDDETKALVSFNLELYSILDY